MLLSSKLQCWYQPTRISTIVIYCTQKLPVGVSDRLNVVIQGDSLGRGPKLIINHTVIYQQNSSTTTWVGVEITVSQKTLKLVSLRLRTGRHNHPYLQILQPAWYERSQTQGNSMN
jgi:hypothetical protein